MKLAGKVALVTGGSRGNGRAIALGLAREGADVAINYVGHEAEARSAVAEIEGLGRRAAAVRVDTSRGDEVARMVEEVMDRFGRIDVLVNNAGVLTRTPFLELGEAEWDRVLAVNLKGCFLVGQAVARRMVARGGGGSIVNVSSINQFIASPNLAHYCASKGGVGMLTRAMALELARIPLKVIGRPEDLVGVAVLLASDDARLITGATFNVDGGVTSA